jgi:hypothetical protein
LAQALGGLGEFLGAFFGRLAVRAAETAAVRFGARLACSMLFWLRREIRPETDSIS